MSLTDKVFIFLLSALLLSTIQECAGNGTMASAVAAEIVRFRGENQEILTGKLTRPRGKGRFPAIILLHGCIGVEKHYDTWAERLSNWGYLALQINGFGADGKLQICSLPSKRAQDLGDAASYLSRLPMVDHKRMALMGWSQPASLTLASFCTRLSVQKRENPFRAAVTFYPYYYEALVRMDLPLLVLMGELDDWCPSGLWRERISIRKARHEIILKVYARAYHCFDAKGVNTYYLDQRLQYCPVAAADAIAQVRKFLGRHLKQSSGERGK